MTTTTPVGTTKEIFNRVYTFINPDGIGIGEWRLTNIPPTNFDYKGIYTILPMTSSENQDTGVVTLGFSILSLANIDVVGTVQDPNEMYRGLSANKAYLPKARNSNLTIIGVPPIDSLENDDNIVIKFDIDKCARLIPKDNSKRARRERMMKIKLNSYNKGSAVVLDATLPIEVVSQGNSDAVSFDIVNLPSI